MLKHDWDPLIRRARWVADDDKAYAFTWVTTATRQFYYYANVRSAFYTAQQERLRWQSGLTCRHALLQLRLPSLFDYIRCGAIWLAKSFRPCFTRQLHVQFMANREQSSDKSLTDILRRRKHSNVCPKMSMTPHQKIPNSTRNTGEPKIKDQEIDGSIRMIDWPNHRILSNIHSQWILFH